MTTTTTTQQLLAELLHEIRYVRAHSSRTAELLATGVKNHVLQMGTIIVPQTGMVDFAFSAVIGSVKIRNLSSIDSLTVAGGPPSTAPTGVGAWEIPPGCVDTVDVFSRQITVYGTWGDRFSYTVYTIPSGPTAPGVGSVVDGGAA